MGNFTKLEIGLGVVLVGIVAYTVWKATQAVTGATASAGDAVNRDINAITSALGLSDALAPPGALTANPLEGNPGGALQTLDPSVTQGLSADVQAQAYEGSSQAGDPAGN